MEDLPLRRFLLIGDSGELDPEIYGEVARTRPERVEGVVICDATGEGRAAPVTPEPSKAWRLSAGTSFGTAGPGR